MRGLAKIVLLLFTVAPLTYSTVFSQEKNVLKLEEAYRLARLNYPISNDRILIDEISALNIELIKRNRLPSISLNAQGTLQSDNIKIGSDDPAFPINIEGPLDTYKAYLGLNFDLYDGGFAASQKKIEEARNLANQQLLKVDLNTLKDRINLLFFNIELAREQKKHLETFLNDIETNQKTVDSKVKNGVALKSELNKLKVRRLELLSEMERLDGDIKAFITIMKKLTGSEIQDDVMLKFPSLFSFQEDIEISRPEQELYNARQEVLRAQNGLTNAGLKPRLSVFGEGGVGNPNPINFSDTETSIYGLVGIKLSWSFLDWGKGKKEKERIGLQVKQIEVDRMTFEFEIHSRKGEFIQRMEALKKQIRNDLEIVELQAEIAEQANTQLQNGVINSSEYLEQVNADLRYRQQLKLHEIQLEQVKVEYLTLFGNL